MTGPVPWITPHHPFTLNIGVELKSMFTSRHAHAGKRTRSPLSLVCTHPDAEKAKWLTVKHISKIIADARLIRAFKLHAPIGLTSPYLCFLKCMKMLETV
ncbi:hypothetical protein AcW1_002877 [Taiwanofungus camphoratus]|nr:hypothetical protein AcV5_001937 [Antrodia cinnamomea]KAI0942192.1 hypothetical protein AcW1_002877 [Antrodia cinnamomea]